MCMYTLYMYTLYVHGKTNILKITTHNSVVLYIRAHKAPLCALDCIPERAA